MTDLKKQLQQFKKDLHILKERKAKYANEAPLALLNTITDYEKAIDLTQQTLIGKLSSDERDRSLKPLI